jgi:hypothetical protein
MDVVSKIPRPYFGGGLLFQLPPLKRLEKDFFNLYSTYKTKVLRSKKEPFMVFSDKDPVSKVFRVELINPTFLLHRLQCCQYLFT